MRPRPSGTRHRAARSACGSSARKGGRSGHDLVGRRRKLLSALMARIPIKARELRYRLAFFLTALVVLALVVTLPFSVKSVVDDVLGQATGRVIPITRRGAGPPDTAASDRLRGRESNYTKLHLAVTSIDE